jgi:hypothetical protein
MIGVVLALIAAPLAGYALVRPLLRDVSPAERFGWSLAAGLLLQAGLTLGLVAVWPRRDYSLPLVLITTLFMTPLLSRGSAAREPARQSLPFPCRLLLLAAGAGIGLFTLAALSEPMWTIDYLAIWGLKAKTIFLTASVPARLFHDPATVWSHPEYPLLLPLDLAALAGWARTWNDGAPALLYPLCQAATAAAAFGFLGRRARVFGGALAALLIGWFFQLYAPVNIGTADIPLALGIVLLSTALLDAFETDSLAPDARLAVAALFCAGMKSEGALLCALAALVWRLFRSQRRARSSAFLAVLVPPVVYLALLRWIRGRVPARDFDFALLTPLRWSEWLSRVGEAIARIVGVEFVAAAVPLVALLLLAYATDAGFADRLLLLLGLQLAFYVLACSVSTFGVAWIVDTSFGRIASALGPALALVVGARVGPVSGAAAAGVVVSRGVEPREA